MQLPNLLDLFNFLVNHIPQPYRTYVLFVFALLVPICTIVVGVLPVKYKNTWWGKALWFVSHVVFHDEPGTIKIPFTPWVIRFSKVTAPPTTAVMVLLALFIGSCGSTQHPGTDAGPPGWINTVETGLHLLGEALPAARAAVDSLPTIPPDQRAAIDASITAVNNNLTQAEQAVALYATNPSMANKCLLRAAVQTVAMASLDIGDALSAAGIVTPGVILVAVGGLGEVADEFLPACVPDAGSGSISMAIMQRLDRLPPVTIQLHLHPVSR